MNKILPDNSFAYSNKERVFRILLSLLILCIGGLIYIAYRQDTLILFSWGRSLGLSQNIESLREFAQNKGVYGWVKNSLPDGLWLFSYMFIIDSIWNGIKSKTFYIFLYSLPFIAIGSEILQYFGIVPGCFDWIDILSYTFAICLYWLIKLIK